MLREFESIVGIDKPLILVSEPIVYIDGVGIGVFEGLVFSAGKKNGCSRVVFFSTRP